MGLILHTIPHVCGMYVIVYDMYMCDMYVSVCVTCVEVCVGVGVLVYVRTLLS